MSRARPWPTVANRHRTNSIFLAGAIRKETATIAGDVTEEGVLIETTESLVGQLRQAINDANLPLALAVINAIEGRVSTIQGYAKQVIDTLEAAPSENGSEPDG